MSVLSAFHAASRVSPVNSGPSSLQTFQKVQNGALPIYAFVYRHKRAPVLRKSRSYSVCITGIHFSLAHL